MRKQENCQIKPTNFNQSTNLLKFINEKNSARRSQGKKCFPQHLFGLSSDAPVQFFTKSSLIVDRGNVSKLNTASKNKPEFFSQKNFFSVGQSIKNSQKNEKCFTTQYNSASQNNKSAFHTKSSKITEFFQKNAWMGDRFQVMGHERSKEALNISKKNNESRIRTAKSLHSNFIKTASSYNFSKKSSQIPTRQSMRIFLINEKNRISQSRNQLRKDKLQQFEEQLPRPQTTFQRSKSQLLRNQESTKKQRQFQVNFLQWGHKDFSVNFLEWNPQRSKQQKAFFQNQKKQKRE